MYTSLINSWRVNRLMSISVALLFFVSTLGFFSFYRHTGPVAFPTTKWDPADPNIRVFFEINKPVAVNAAKYAPYGASFWDLPESARWNEPLGEDLCIIDLDNRPFDEVGQVFGPEPMSWKDPQAVHGLSLGMLNHWVYSKIHGYKYYYVNIGEYADRRNSWKKAPVITRILKDHRVCIFIDSDATFNHLDLPFEWLLNYWRFHPGEQSLALAYDPDSPKNTDMKGQTYLNTGFMVAQNIPRTYEILKSWEECPDEGGKHPECVEFRKNRPGWPTDQGGFGNFIRYEFDKPTDIMGLLCTEGNGFVESKSGCDGIFVSHWWTGKNSWIKEGIGRQVPGQFLPLLHTQFLLEKKQFFINEPDLMAKPVRGPINSTTAPPPTEQKKDEKPKDAKQAEQNAKNEAEVEAGA
jgi:hypothetical protein